jgi:hypothetical protein
LEQDFCEAWDQVYEFHFGWLLILNAFIAWEMPKGETFSEIELFDPLDAKFTNAMVFEQHGETMEVKHGFPYILFTTEEGH